MPALLENQRDLLAFLAARRLGSALLFAAALAATLLRAGWRRAGQAAPLVPMGVVYWSFIEYALHRWFGAGPIRRLTDSRPQSG